MLWQNSKPCHTKNKPIIKTKNKTEVFNQLEQQIINTTVQKSYGIVYKADFLKSIKCKVDHDQRYRLLHPNVCSTVRKLKLNKKKTSRRNNQVPSVNLENLIIIKCTQSKYIYNISTKVKLSTINIQSLTSKELTLIEH